MSNISRLTNFAAGGAGGDKGWALEMVPTSPNVGGAYLKAVIEKSDGSFAATGGSEAADVITITFNADGTVSSFHKIADGSGSGSTGIYASTLCEDVNNDVWLGGYWYSNGQASGEAAWFVRTDDGDPYTSPLGYYGASSRGGDMSIDYYPAGQSIFTAFNDLSKGLIQKFNLGGTRQWVYKLDWNELNYVRYAHWETNSLRPGYGGNFLVGMTTAISASQGHYAADLVKIDENGSLEANYRSHSATTNTGFGEGQSITSDVNFNYDCGFASDFSGSNGEASCHIRKIRKSNNTLVWERFYVNKVGSTLANSEGRAIAVDGDGNVYVTANFANGTSHDVIIKYNSSGTLQWSMRIGKTSRENQLDALVFGSDGFIYAGGWTRSSANQNVQMFKIPADGLAAGTYGGYTVTIPSYNEPTGFLTFADLGGSSGSGSTSNVTLSSSDATVSSTNTLTDL